MTAEKGEITTQLQVGCPGCGAMNVVTMRHDGSPHPMDMMFDAILQHWVGDKTQCAACGKQIGAILTIGLEDLHI